VPTKRALVANPPPRGKNPVVPQRVGDDDTQRISWRLGDTDRNGVWAWTTLSEADSKRVVDFLSEIDKMTWADACQGYRPRLKSVDADGVCADARTRLVEIQKDDEDKLWELHLSGIERIWAIRRGSVCHLLWWDPNHTVWPSRRR
jgi:hypothetical protein